MNPSILAEAAANESAPTIDQLATLLASNVYVELSERGFTSKGGATKLGLLQSLIADWIELNMEAGR